MLVLSSILWTRRVRYDDLNIINYCCLYSVTSDVSGLIPVPSVAICSPIMKFTSVDFPVPVLPIIRILIEVDFLLYSLALLANGSLLRRSPSLCNPKALYPLAASAITSLQCNHCIQIIKIQVAVLISPNMVEYKNR